MIYNSFDVKSNGKKYRFFKFKPKTELNQTLEKPTRPKTLAVNKSIPQITGEISYNPEKIKNSHENFSVPGKPAYKMHINSIDIPSIGVKCKILQTSITERELNLF